MILCKLALFGILIGVFVVSVTGHQWWTACAAYVASVLLIANILRGQA